MAAPVTVVKIGGSTLGQHDTSLDDLAALHAKGHRLVVVHGGGATISEWLAQHNIESRFVNGLRATDERALDVVVAVLAGLVNKRLVAELQGRGASAFGLSGADGAILRARRYDPELGLVGEIVSVDRGPLRNIINDAIAVLAPIAIEIEIEGEEARRQLLNVNADTVAGEVAAALGAERLVFLTDVPGVMNAASAVYPQLSASEARELLETLAVTGGMIPKVQAALRAAGTGVRTVITDGRQSGTLLGLLSGEQATRLGGTRIG